MQKAPARHARGFNRWPHDARRTPPRNRGATAAIRITVKDRDPPTEPASRKAGKVGDRMKLHLQVPHTGAPPVACRDYQAGRRRAHLGSVGDR